MSIRAIVVALGVIVAATGSASAQTTVATLKGLVFLTGPQEVAAGGWAGAMPADGVDVTRVPALADPSVVGDFRLLVGQPFDARLAETLKSVVGLRYKALNRPFVLVEIPPQDVTRGIVQVVVIESRLGALTIEGNRWFSDKAIVERVGLKPGDPIDTARLDGAVRWINSNPYRHAAPVATAGASAGTTDVSLRVENRFPMSVSAGVGNTGNASTGELQVATGLNWGNAFGRGDTLDLHFSTAKHFDALRTYSGAYIANLPGSDQISVSATYARTRPLTAPGAVLGTIGTIATVSPRYVWAASTPESKTRDVSLGMDWKRTNNDLLFGGESVFTSTATIAQLVAGYREAFRSRRGVTSAHATLVVSPGRLSDGNSDAAFDAQRQGARSRYAYVRATVGHDAALPGGLVWSTHATGQLSGSRLIAIEQLSFGGDGSVRGFRNSIATRDNGVLVNSELRLPPLSIFSRRSTAKVRDELGGFVFADYGFGSAHKQPGIPNARLASAGPGLRYRWGRFGSIQLSYGRVIHEHGVVRHGRGRLQVQTQVRF